MRHALATWVLVIAFLTTLTGTALARAVNDLENRVGVFEPYPNIDAYAIGPQAVERHRGNTIVVYDSATGVWEYVNQNPWTFFDPLGLESYHWWQGGWLREKAVDPVYNFGGGVAKSGAETVSGALNAGKAIVTDPIGTAKAVKESVTVEVELAIADVTLIVTDSDARAAAGSGAVEGFSDGLADLQDPSKLGENWGDAAQLLVGGRLATEGLTRVGRLGRGQTVGKCFPEGTLVLTQAGAQPIEQIAVGDVVLAYNQNLDQVVTQRVLDVIKGATLFWAEVDLGVEKIVSTRGHRFWVESEEGWIEAANLEPGMTVRESDGEIRTVKQVEIRALANPEATFNLEVANLHNYFVGTSHVLVHNGDTEEFDIGRYDMGDFPKPQNSPNFSSGRFEKHELLQSKWLQVHGYGDRASPTGRKNPAIAIDRQHYRGVINPLQSDLGLHDENTLRGQTANQNIRQNIDVAKAAGVPREKIAELARDARNFAKDLCP